MPTPVASSPSSNLPKGSILPGVGKADGNGEFTPIASGSPGYSAPPPTSTTPTTGGTQPTTQPALPPAQSNPAPVNPPPTGGAQNPPTPSLVLPGAGGNDPSAPTPGQVQNATNTLGQSQNELETSELSAEDSAVQRSQDLIDQVSGVYSDELASAASNAEGAEAAGGQGGGPVGASAEYTAMKPILDSQAAAVATEIQNIQNNAASVFESTESDAQTNATDTLANNQAAKTALLTSVGNMAAVGYTASQLQQQNPDEYDYLLNYGFNGDANAMNTAFLNGAKQTLLNNGQPVYTAPDGKSQTYAQMTMNPDGTPSLKYTTIQLPYTSIPGWTTTKISTTSSMEVDPNNPGNVLVITTDPITGTPTFMGAGTGSALAEQFNSQVGGGSGSSSSSSSSSSGTLSPTAQNYISTATTTAGIEDPTTLFTTAVNGDGTAANPGVGLGAMLSGVVAAEGGSPANVKNNPGNVLYVPGMAGATDSGVHPTDNPKATFASFDTSEAGANASGKALTDIAASLGPNATVQDVLNKYANLGIGAAPTSTDASQTTTSAASGGVGTNGLPISQYGALANVPGFDPKIGPGATDAQVTDSQAYNYITEYLNGQTPSPSSIGISTRSGSGAQFDAVAERAKTLYNQATDQNLPNQTVLTNNLGLVSKNNSLLNNLNVQTDVITKNFGLSLDNENANNINQTAPAINKTIDSLSEAAGSDSVAQYLSQNATLQQEIGSLLSVKNAAGVTVADKMAAGDLLPADLSASQQKQILSTLLKEARNQQQTIGAANAALYQQTDPLGLDPNNPVNAPGYQEMTSADATNNYDGTWTLNGSTVKVNADGTVSPVE